MKTRRIVLASHPVGVPKESDFRIEDGDTGSAEILIRTRYISVDPYIRGRLRLQPPGASYIAGFNIGSPIESGCVGEVIESSHPDFKAGDIDEGMMQWSDYNVSSGRGLRKIDPALAPISTALGVLGMPGMTAYFGLLDICDPKPGETVVVSGAAGAVGSLAGQIAKIRGCRVVGIAGSDDKVRWITGELGFDAGFNYKTAGSYAAALREYCPNGIDCYFDNVGGAITDAVLTQLNTGARIALCGQISQYNNTEPEMGPRLLFNLIIRQAKMQGFLVFQYTQRYPEGIRQMAEWLRDGKVRYREDIANGLENTPRAFIAMLTGGNTGKQLVEL